MSLAYDVTQVLQDHLRGLAVKTIEAEYDTVTVISRLTIVFENGATLMVKAQLVDEELPPLLKVDLFALQKVELP